MGRGWGLVAASGGRGPLFGSASIGVLGGLVNLVVPLSGVGASGPNTVTAGAAALQVTVTGASWTTGRVSVTGVSTLGTISATTSGFDARTAAHAGTLVLVTPIRVLTNVGGNLGLFAVQILTFVPEPGTLLLFVCGGAGVALVGLRQRSAQRRGNGS